MKNNKEVTETNGTAENGGKSEGESGDSEEDDAEQDHKWVQSLENFWDKALKLPDICVDYVDKEPEGNEFVVECVIGKLVVEGSGESRLLAQENAAQFMFNMIESILENDGTEVLKRNIIFIVRTEVVYQDILILH